VNRQIKALGIIVIVCYVAVFLKLNQVQVLEAQAYSDRPDNTRQLQRDFNQPRGDIITADGAVAATSDEVRAALQYQRVYPDKELFSSITGYYSFALGSDGVERTYNEELAGRTASLRLAHLSTFFSDTSSQGDVVLTVRKDVQETARAALGDRAGSVVALDPRTGGILAMWSNPTFDPNLLSNNDAEAATKAKEFYEEAFYRVCFMGAENSVGFHNPPEGLRILGDSVAFGSRAEAYLRQALTKAGVDVPLKVDLEIMKYVDQRGTKKLKFNPQLEFKDPYGLQDKFF